jgi:hypothetical protein
VALERKLRSREPSAIDEVVGLLDGAQAKKAEKGGLGGLAAARFLLLLRRSGASVVEPSPGPWCAPLYKRLNKALADLGVTEAHAEMLGKWMAGQPWLGSCDLDRLVRNLTSFLAQAATDKPASTPNAAPFNKGGVSLMDLDED